jgi:hypothetical protein
MLDHLIHLLEREIESIKHSILHGSCPDYTSYREQVAQVLAFEVAIELAKKAFAEDDDDAS